MLQSFIVYIIFGFSLFFLGSISAQRQAANNSLNRKTTFWEWDVILALLIFAFISGVRWNVGVDHLHYLENYLKIQNGGYSIFEKEYGFEFITRLFAESRIHFSFYFGFLAFLQLLFIYRAFKDEKYLYPFLGIIIIFGPEYLSWMNGIRQMIVATVFVWSIQFIQRRQLFKYIIIIGLSSLIHKSALILMVFYFIPQVDYFRNRTLTFILAGISLFLGLNNYWIENLNNIGVILEFIGYEKSADQLTFLIQDQEVRNIGPRRLSIIITALVTIWYAPKLKIRFKHSNFLAYFNLSIFGFLLYNLFGNTHHIFIRPITYLTIFSVPITAYLLFFLYERIKRLFVTFIFVLLTVISYLPLSIVANHGKGNQDFTNYKFFWHETD